MTLYNCTNSRNIYIQSSGDSDNFADTFVFNKCHIKDDERMKNVLTTVNQKYFECFQEYPYYYKFIYKKSHELYVQSYRYFTASGDKKEFSENYVVCQINGKCVFLLKDNYDESFFSIDSTAFDTMILNRVIEEFLIVQFDSMYNCKGSERVPVLFVD